MKYTVSIATTFGLLSLLSTVYLRISQIKVINGLDFIETLLIFFYLKFR